jgi:hypothetical protein
MSPPPSDTNSSSSISNSANVHPLEMWQRRLAETIETCTEILSQPSLGDVALYAALEEFRVVKDCMLLDLPADQATAVSIILNNAQSWQSLQDKLDSTPESVKLELERELSELQDPSDSSSAEGGNSESYESGTQVLDVGHESPLQKCGSSGEPFSGAFLRKCLVFPVISRDKHGEDVLGPFMHAGSATITIREHLCPDPATCDRMASAMKSRTQAVEAQVRQHLRAKGQSTPILSVRWGPAKKVASTRDGVRHIMEQAVKYGGAGTTAPSF